MKYVGVSSRILVSGCDSKLEAFRLVVKKRKMIEVMSGPSGPS